MYYFFTGSFLIVLPINFHLKFIILLNIFVVNFIFRESFKKFCRNHHQHGDICCSVKSVLRKHSDKTQFPVMPQIVPHPVTPQHRFGSDVLRLHLIMRRIDESQMRAIRAQTRSDLRLIG